MEFLCLRLPLGLTASDIRALVVSAQASSQTLFHTPSSTNRFPSYIDAEDTPPSSCSVVVARDCGAKGCIVSAIANYTERVQQPELLAKAPEQRKQALEFLIHLLGDITMFLHIEAEKVGGNKIKVTWKGEETNLHSAWVGLIHGE